MDHYLFTARSITHAQQMAKTLERGGIPIKMRRVGTAVTKSGCGYTLEIPGRKYAQALDLLREAGQRPIKVLHVSNGEQREVAAL